MSFVEVGASYYIVRLKGKNGQKDEIIVSYGADGCPQLQNLHQYFQTDGSRA